SRGVINSRTDFLSFSKAVFLRMSAPGSSFLRLPTRASSRSPDLEVLSRSTRATAPMMPATSTKTAMTKTTGERIIEVSSITKQRSFLEQIRGQLDAGAFEARHEGRPNTGRLELPVRP